MNHRKAGLMIIAVDIGNTNIVVGAIESDSILFTERISTHTDKTELEYALDFKLIFELHHIANAQIEGSIISSVVPPLSNIIKTALAKLLSKDPLVVGPGVKNGLSIRIDNPAQLGSDLVVTAVAAIASYPVPSIVIDMGTATTFSVINSKRQYIGGAIVPGAVVALNSLSSQTSQLPFISLDAPKQVIGSNTIDCMKSGSLFGTAAMIDGMIRRIRAELRENAIVIATGGIAHAILPYCEEEISYEPDLLLKGLGLIYKKNQVTH